jgi:hypothetical protein
MSASGAVDETSRRDDALSAACVGEYMEQPELGAVDGAAPLGHPCVAAPEQWWPNPGEDPVASFGRVGVSYNGSAAVRDVSLPVPRGSIVALIATSRPS